MIRFGNPFTQQNSPPEACAWQKGCVCPPSQFRIVVLSQPMIFARSFCSNPKSNRRLRISSPVVLASFGYALFLGFFAFRRTRQKINATSAAHCHREYEFARTNP